MATTPSEPPTDDTALGRAISKVPDPELRKVLAREVELLKDSRRFGLVFDRHLPESARLSTHAIRRGVSVVRRDEIVDVPRIVTGIDGGLASLDDDSQEAVEDLVVLRDFGDVVYPGLRSVERIDRGPKDAPWHTVINGENLHVLQMLRQTHRASVDLIYIDPPYNTGNDGWIYNDKYVDSNDRAKSSKWLSFMERRLTIARSLLKPTGVIIVAIGDDEHHRLRMLMDQVFGASNFISNVVWQGGRKNDSRYVSNAADYMLVYARDESELAGRGVKWRQDKDGQAEAQDVARDLLTQADGDARKATAEFRKWLKASGVGEGVTRYNFVEEGTGRVYNGDGPLSDPKRGPRYDLLHPIDGQPVTVPRTGWRVYDPEKMAAMVARGEIIFGPDHVKTPRRKVYLDVISSQAPDSVFSANRLAASERLARILGDKRFPFPKDHEVLMRWIRLTAPSDAVALDFFGGSGTTTEAVMRLNAEDGGTRQSILVTNNEVGAKRAKELRKAGQHPGDVEWESSGVFEYVTRPRISTVVTGERPDGSTYSEGLAANVDFLELTYLDAGDIRRGREFGSIAPMLWLEAGAIGECIADVPDSGWALEEAYGVLFDVDALKPFAEAVAERAKTDDLPGLIFVITDSPTELRVATERLPVGCKVRRLYESYVERFALGEDGGQE